MNYLFVIIIFYLIGVGIYTLDLWVLKQIKKQKGAIFGQSILVNIITALALTIVVLYLFPEKEGFITALLNFICMTAGLALGFIYATWALKMFPKLKDYVTKVSEGKVDIVSDFKKAAKKTAAEFTTGEDAEPKQKEKPVEKVTVLIVEEKTVETPPEKKEEADGKDNRSFEEKMSNPFNTKN